jgi:hypothetical protein
MLLSPCPKDDEDDERLPKIITDWILMEEDGKESQKKF